MRINRISDKWNTFNVYIILNFLNLKWGKYDTVSRLVTDSSLEYL